MILKQGDTFPNPSADLNADLTGITAKVFRVRSAVTGAFVLSNSTNVVVDDATTGLVHYDWQPADTALLVPGAYFAEFVITFASGDIQRFPQDSSLEIVVREAAPAA